MGIYMFFTAVWNGVQITCGSKYKQAIHRLSIARATCYFQVLT